MSIEIDHVTVFPIVWIPDVYVNPSNNGNLQSAYYKNLDDAVKRTNEEFYSIFLDQLKLAKDKKNAKTGDVIYDHSKKKYIKKLSRRWIEIDKKE